MNPLPMLEMLRSQGVKAASFAPDGALLAVEFWPAVPAMVESLVQDNPDGEAADIVRRLDGILIRGDSAARR